MSDARPALDYAPAGDADRTPRRLAGVGAGLAGLPLVVGVGVTGLYATLFDDRLVDLGLLTLLLGPVVLLAGLVVVAVAHDLDRGRRDRDPAVARRARVAVVAAVASLPAAFVCVHVGIKLKQSATVVVVNAGDVAVRDVRVEFAGNVLSPGTLSPGVRWRGRAWPSTGPAAVTWSAPAGRRTHLHAREAGNDDFWHGATITLDRGSAVWR